MTSVTDRMNTRSNIPHGSAEDEAESEITVSTGVATRTRGKSDTQHLVCDDKPGQAGASAPSPVRRSGRMKDRSVSQTNLREGLAEWEAARLSHQTKSPNSNKSPAINKTFKVMSPANTDMRKKKALVASSGHRRRDAGRHKMASSLLKGAKSRASMHGHYNRKDRCEGTKGHGASRPKRNIPKIVEKTAALSWREEQNLKKALYASLHETKKPLLKEGPLSYEDIVQVAGISPKSKSKSGLKLIIPPKNLNVTPVKSCSSTTSNGQNNSGDKKCMKSPMRAQRKFAAGSRPESPCTSPLKLNKKSRTPRKLLNTSKRAKTEDFLTFLCLRGSQSMPSHLDFFNYADTESIPSFPGTPRQSQDGSRPATPISTLFSSSEPKGNGRQFKEKIELPSRASSSDRELSVENNDLGVKPLSPSQQPPQVISKSPSAVEETPIVVTETAESSDEESLEEKTEVSTQTPYPCIHDLPDIVDSDEAAAESDDGDCNALDQQDSTVFIDNSVEEIPAQTVATEQNMLISLPNMASATPALINSLHSNQANYRANAGILVHNGRANDLSCGMPVMLQNGFSLGQDDVQQPSQLQVGTTQAQMISAYGMTAYGINVPFCQSLAMNNMPVSNLPVNMPINLHPGACMNSVALPSSQPPLSGTALVRASHNLAGVASNYILQCQNMMQPTRLVLAPNSNNIQTPAFLTAASQTLIASETGLALLPQTQSQHHHSLRQTSHLQDRNVALCNNKPSTVSLAMLPSTGPVSVNAATVTGQTMEPAASNQPGVQLTPALPKEDACVGSSSRQPLKIAPKPVTSAVEHSTAKFYNKVAQQKFQKEDIKDIDKIETKRAPKESIRTPKSIKKGTVRSQSTLKMPSTSAEASRKLIRKARTRAYKVERRRLRSDTKRDQEIQLEVARSSSSQDNSSCEYINLTTSNKLLDDKKTGVKSLTKSKDSENPKETDSVAASVVNRKRKSSVESCIEISDSPEQPQKSLRSSSVSPTKKPKQIDIDLTGSNSDNSPHRHVRTRSTRGSRDVSPASSVASSTRRGSTQSHSSTSRASPAIEIMTRSHFSRKSPGRNTPVLESTTPLSSGGTLPKMCFRESFPAPNDNARIMEIPTYRPSPEQFNDPISYLQSIQEDAGPFGICRIVPPDGWAPECKISEELRFTTQVQHIHKMQDRWGPNVFQLECIKKHLETQNIHLEHIPVVGGVELDLPALSEAIKLNGGLQSTIDRNKWHKVADSLKIPSQAQDRTARLYDAYCKYLLSYDTLCQSERQKLQAQVEADRWKNHLWDQECVTRGKSKTLIDFFRIARYTQSIWFPQEEPTPSRVETEYWDLVEKKDQHVSIQTGHVDTSVCGSAFPSKKESPYSRHGWNFHILQNNNSSVLRYAGPVSGVTVPTLHIGMLFSTSCWARNLHFLPCISYLHTGDPIIWYCIPASEEEKLKAAMEEIVPELINADDPIWLPEDSIMVRPEVLQEHGISMCRVVQHQGEFIIVLPHSYISTISCGYNIAESIHVATADWIPLGYRATELLQESGEPDMFCMDRLLINLARSDKATPDMLKVALPFLESLVDREVRLRKKLRESGLKNSERLKSYDDQSSPSKRKHRYDTSEDEENRCEGLKKICYVSSVMNEAEEVVYSLEHACSGLKPKLLKNCKLVYRMDENELLSLLQKVKKQVDPNTPSSAAKKKGSSVSKKPL